MQSKVQTTALNRNHLVPKQTKQPKNHLILSYANPLADNKEKFELKTFVFPVRESKIRIPSALNSPRFDRKNALTKSKERGKSLNNTHRSSKENTSRAKHIQLRRNSKNQMDYYRPSPILSQSDDEIKYPKQEEKIRMEAEDKPKIDSVIELDVIPNILSFKRQANMNKPEKKRATLIRMGKPLRPRPENFEQEGTSDCNRVVIVNPAIEQEIFKKCLEADKQTFEFEQLVISGSYAKSESSSSMLMSNSRTNSDVITPNKISNVEAKLQIITGTKDSFNTIAGLTTNSTSRNKGSLGGVSGVYEKENFGRLELIEWSKEGESVSNTPVKKKSTKHSRKNSCSKESQMIKEKISQKKARPKQGSFALAEALTHALNNLKKDKAQIGKGLKKRNLSVQYMAHQ